MLTSGEENSLMFESDDTLERSSGGAEEVDTPARQRTFTRWQGPIAFGPFALVIAFAQLPVSAHMPDWLILPAVIVTVVWAVAFMGYLMYLNYQK